MKKNWNTGLYFFSFLLLSIGCTNNSEDESKYEFTENIRSTEARTPEEEMAGFKLPDGFEIELFASEPDIGKPMNMTFDAKGRMWVTQSSTYPLPNESGFGQDRISILEDTDKDGRADSFIHFSDTLNVPIGLLPTEEGALGFSIPNIYNMKDTDGDGKVDHSSIAIGHFGFVDTHGMVSNFIRGYDGWVHACHGFTNRSRVAGTDGDSITLISGNTFRFKMDGSHIEQTTFGQINPFGLAYDDLGYVYSTDSHSSPLHQLIRGGDYPHFGKEEIMGFGPDMKSFEDEATALCGIAYYGDTMFPEEFQGNFFVGDAVKSRVHRYSWTLNGSTPVGKSEVDFIKSEDPWFRPVNIKLGPDGALYVADFYNAIIGHYEVPLGHPKRDKNRGRIWRITYKGNQNEVKNLNAATIDELITTLKSDNLTTRMMATDQIVDRVGDTSSNNLIALLNKDEVLPREYVHSLWALQRLGGLSNELIQKSANHQDPKIRLHTMRILREENLTPDFLNPIVATALNDNDVHVKRAAVELLTMHPDMTALKSALKVHAETDTADTHLIYTARLVTRNLLRNNDLLKEALTQDWNQQEKNVMAGVLIDVYAPEAAIFLADYFTSESLPDNKINIAYRHMARFAPKGILGDIIKNAREKYSQDVKLVSAAFKGMQTGLTQREEEVNRMLLNPWAVEIVENVFDRYPLTSSEKSKKVMSYQELAANLIGDYKIQSKENELSTYLLQNNAVDRSELTLKASSFRALMQIAESNMELAEDILKNENELPEFKQEVVKVLGDFPGAKVNQILASVDNAPPDLEKAIVSALASSAEGKDIIFQLVQEGKVTARTLIDPKIEERILLNISVHQRNAYEGIVANLSPISEEKEKLIAERLKSFESIDQTKADLDSGKVIFYRYCGACHRAGGRTSIGPQLNGVGKRGAEALIEKVLDPNRNITEAFRNYTIKLKDGRVIAGLLRREEGETIVLADMAGKEFSIPNADIVSKEASRYTLMPDNFGETIPEDEFNSLISYLLAW